MSQQHSNVVQLRVVSVHAFSADTSSGGQGKRLTLCCDRSSKCQEIHNACHLSQAHTSLKALNGRARWFHSWKSEPHGPSWQVDVRHVIAETVSQLTEGWEQPQMEPLWLMTWTLIKDPLISGSHHFCTADATETRRKEPAPRSQCLAHKSFPKSFGCTLHEHRSPFVSRAERPEIHRMLSCGFGHIGLWIESPAHKSGWTGICFELLENCATIVCPTSSENASWQFWRSWAWYGCGSKHTLSTYNFALSIFCSFCVEWQKWTTDSACSSLVASHEALLWRHLEGIPCLTLRRCATRSGRVRHKHFLEPQSWIIDKYLKGVTAARDAEY